MPISIYSRIWKLRRVYSAKISKTYSNAEIKPEIVCGFEIFRSVDAQIRNLPKGNDAIAEVHAHEEITAVEIFEYYAEIDGRVCKKIHA